MKPQSEAMRLADDGLEAGLTAAIAELENAAIERARTLIAEEAKALRDHIHKLEEHIASLQQRPQPTSTAADAPASTGTAAKPAVPTKIKAVRPPSKALLPGELPPLPTKRTLATISDYLQSLGFNLVSYRASGGGAWVFKTQDEFGHVVDHLKKNGVGVSRYPRGRKRYPGDHFEIDPSKVLPDK